MATKNEQQKYLKLFKTLIRCYINHKMPRELGWTLKLTYSGT